MDSEMIKPKGSTTNVLKVCRDHMFFSLNDLEHFQDTVVWQQYHNVEACPSRPIELQNMCFSITAYAHSKMNLLTCSCPHAIQLVTNTEAPLRAFKTGHSSQREMTLVMTVPTLVGEAALNKES